MVMNSASSASERQLAAIPAVRAWLVFMAFMVFCMVIVGGAGTLVGALFGAMLITVLKSVIGTWTEHHHIVIGALFMASIMFLPRGIMGMVRPRVEAALWRHDWGAEHPATGARPETKEGRP